MHSNEGHKQANCLKFLRSYFAPAKRAVEAANKLGSKDTSSQAHGSFLESFWWLYLGLEMEYFPASAGILFWSETRKDFLRSFNYFAKRKYRTVSAFTDSLWLRLQSTFKVSNNLFTFDGDMHFLDGSALISQFQTIFMIECHFARDCNAQILSSVITFSSPREWNKLRIRKGRKRRQISLTAVRDALIANGEFPNRIGEERVYAGFFRALEHMMTYQYFFDSLRRNPTVQERDAYLLERRCKEVSNWRLNFYIGDAKERFLELAEDLGAELVKEVKVQKFPLEYEPNSRDLTKYVEGLIDRWSNTQPLVLSARG